MYQEIVIVNEKGEKISSQNFDFIMIHTKSRSYEAGRKEFVSKDSPDKMIIENQGRIEEMYINGLFINKP